MSRLWATAQQPLLFPPIYMMERFARCHTVVLHDNAKFRRDCAQFVLQGNGAEVLLTMPVVKASHLLTFRERKLHEFAQWSRKVIRKTDAMYYNSKYYLELRPWFIGVLGVMSDTDRFDVACNAALAEISLLLGLPTAYRLSSGVIADRPNEPTEWIAQICEALGATDYLQGEKSMRAYFVKGPLERVSVMTWGQNFAVAYPPRGHAGLSILDVLFRQGVAGAQDMLGISNGPGWNSSMRRVVR